MRISFVSGPRVTGATTAGSAAPATATVREAGSVFLSDLMRTQLRLAGACLMGFLLLSLALWGLIVMLSTPDAPVIFGVPSAWLLQAYGYYPVMLFFALAYARYAARNERRFRALIASEADEGGCAR